MNISDILRTKGSAVTTASPDDTVAEVIDTLGEHNVGALVVTDGEAVVGIVSERDVVRRLREHGAELLTMTAGQIMTRELFTAAPEHSVDDIASAMTERRIRHVPVLVDGRLAGVVSIGDVVLSRINQLEQDRSQLESYIAG